MINIRRINTIKHDKLETDLILSLISRCAMGQDHSKLTGLLIDEKAVEVTDFWSLFNAEVPNDDGATRLSIFKGEPLVSGQLWVLQSPLERAIKVSRSHEF